MSGVVAPDGDPVMGMKTHYSVWIFPNILDSLQMLQADNIPPLVAHDYPILLFAPLMHCMVA